MKIYTLAYLEKNNKILMLYRDKKENDINKGKWLGLGGKLESGEDPYESIKREVFEESGLTLIDAKMKGLIKFKYKGNLEYIFVFYSNNFTGNLIKDCNEGTLKYINKDEVLKLNLWESDYEFLNEILSYNDDFFIYNVEYDNNEKLIKCIKEY